METITRLATDPGIYYDYRMHLDNEIRMFFVALLGLIILNIIILAFNLSWHFKVYSALHPEWDKYVIKLLPGNQFMIIARNKKRIVELNNALTTTLFEYGYISVADIKVICDEDIETDDKTHGWYAGDEDPWMIKKVKSQWAVIFTPAEKLIGN